MIYSTYHGKKKNSVYIYLCVYTHNAFVGITYKKEVRFDARYGTREK
jgi:hypothetical protein